MRALSLGASLQDLKRQKGHLQGVIAASWNRSAGREMTKSFIVSSHQHVLRENTNCGHTSILSGIYDRSA